MKHNRIAAMVGTLVALAAQPVVAGLITETIEGTIMATSGSPANVGGGTVSGSVTYDDAAGFPFLGTVVFDLTAFSLEFSNGPTVTEADDPFAQIELDEVTGDLVSLAISFSGFDGFGLTGLDFGLDPFSNTFFFAQGSSLVAEGSLGVAAAEVPEPATLWLLAFGLLGLCSLRLASHLPVQQVAIALPHRHLKT